MIESAPDGILYFFAIALFVGGVFVFFSAGEGPTPLSVILGIAFFVLGETFVWLAVAQEVLIALPQL